MLFEKLTLDYHSTFSIRVFAAALIIFRTKNLNLFVTSFHWFLFVLFLFFMFFLVMFLYFIYSSLSPTSSYPTSLGVTDLWEKPWDMAVHLGRIPAFSDLPDPGPPPPPPPPLPRPGVGRRRSRRRRRKSRRRIEKYRKRVLRTVG